MVIYTKYMLTTGVQWVETASIVEPEGIYFRPMPDHRSAVELAMDHADDGFVGRPAVAMMGYDPKGDRWETLDVCYSAHGLKRCTRMMFGLNIEWDGDAPLEFDRGQEIKITRYTTNSGESVISFSGLMTGMVAARSADEKLRAERLAERLGVIIKEES
ncbi:hypothetical protein [Burkholderia multivorans]|uniref:hypothetical protein n=1 Tax=Burkholderia multivorans TaxID=87883 RepID=UPI001C2272B9|nr:hypothetical protein [Burkholderia multivorans]MBU9211683.1 hypothetical protein [Burkholderia multivorans]